MNSVYPRQRRQEFGRYLAQFYKDEDMWPDDLLRFYKERFLRLKPSQQCKGLTVELLLEWMAEYSQMPQLFDQEHRQYFMHLLGSWGRWDATPNRGGDNAPLLIAMAECGIVLDENNQPITQARDLIRYLFGASEQNHEQLNAEICQ